jgi:hypothetical protein
MTSSTPLASAPAVASERPAVSPVTTAAVHDNTLGHGADHAGTMKEEPVELDEDEAGDDEDRTGGEGSIKRPRLRLSQACK